MADTSEDFGMIEEIERVSKLHSELFHYTTVAAFRSIYESRQLWATHYAHMNDSSELTRFRLKVCEFITPIVRNIFDNRVQSDARFAAEAQKAGGIDAVVRQDASMHLDTLHRTTFGERGLHETFICSFCGHNPESCARDLESPAAKYATQHGLLSQWRGYGTGGGVAIVLDTKEIEELMRHEKCIFSHPVNHIGDVTYDDDDYLKEKPEFRKVFDLFPEILCKYYKRVELPYEKIFTDFVMGSTLVKHRAFREETEVRIVLSPTPTNPNSYFYTDQDNRRPIKYRSKGEREVRYIELFGNARLPIKRVIVGPSRVQNLNYQTIKEVVSGSSSNIEVIKSETPFLE
jgi:Protein of unknown function (DUF2971)